MKTTLKLLFVASLILALLVGSFVALTLVSAQGRGPLTQHCIDRYLGSNDAKFQACADAAMQNKVYETPTP